MKELEGKNIAHYSVMLTAYISSRTDANKAIFMFSLASISLLLAAYEKPISSICKTNIIYLFSMVVFVIAVISTLFIHVSNTKAIESYLRSEKETQHDFQLKSWMYINYVAFGFGVLSFLLLGVIKVYG